MTVSACCTSSGIRRSGGKGSDHPYTRSPGGSYRLARTWSTMPESDSSMLHRLFHWPVTIASFAPERYRIHWGGRSSGSTAASECVLKMLKPVSLIYHLHVRLGNRIVLWALGPVQKSFRAESDPNAASMHKAQLDASFRLTSVVFYKVTRLMIRCILQDNGTVSKVEARACNGRKPVAVQHISIYGLFELDTEA